MKASVRWLRELCPHLPDDAAAIAARLTAAGIEVEGAQSFGLGAEACVVASVVSTRPHPSRSGLRLVTVNRGSGELEVVCGAPNVPEPGGLVVLAPLGAHLPATGMTIERRSVGGVPSEGMLCSEAELGLGSDGDGILVLAAKTAAPGTPFVQALPAARDTILEIGLTPNRPDGLGHVGLAREAAALFDVPFAQPIVSPLPPGQTSRTRSEDLAAYASVTIEDGARCPHYGAAVLIDAKIGPSPLDVRWRLASLGVRPISNVVDVTNLVMLGLGHPMHAFDLDRVRGRAIVVRRARAGESLRTLDGVDRALDPDDLVICDGERPVALAGVMGGGDSEISASTQRVLLECAYFDPRGVRRTARRHGLHTEASHRFERGVDWGDTRVALGQAGDLVARLAGATLVQDIRVVEAQPFARRSVVLRHHRIGALLGTEVPAADARAILERLGFGQRASQADLDVWEVPTFRPDVAREVDLIEEVARVRGFDAIPTELPAVHPTRDAAPRDALARRARATGVALGLSEAIALSYGDPRDLEAVGAPPPAVTLRNPLGEEAAVLRTSLLPGLLRAVARARRHGERDARLFAVGPVFLAPKPVPNVPSSAKLPEERLTFTAVVAGEHAERLRKARAIDVWDATGLAEGFVLRLVRREVTVQRPSGKDERPRALHPRGVAWIDVGSTRVGSLGLLHPDVAEAFDLSDSAVAVVEIDLSALSTLGARPIRFNPLPRFPASTRDLAIVVREDVVAGDIERAVRDAAGDLVDLADLAGAVALFDRFVGGNVPPGHVSLAFHVVYRAPDRTLTDAEVDTRHAQVVAAVEARFGATLRV